jgi:hypothetical protein
MHLHRFGLLITPAGFSVTNASCGVQLYGNPLEVLPELSPCVSLRHLSLANARISSDEDFENWTVEVHPRWVVPYVRKQTCSALHPPTRLWL